MGAMQLAARPWMTTLAETGDPSVKAVLVELVDRPDIGPTCYFSQLPGEIRLFKQVPVVGKSCLSRKLGGRA
jgi:hypothetical protein